MKKQVFIIALLFVFTFVGNGIVHAQKAKNDSDKNHQKEKITEPTAKESLNLILSNGDIPLTVDSSCKSVASSLDDKTILDYISGLMSFQTEPESSNRIEYTFTKKEDKKHVYWVCDLMFLGKN